MSEKARETGKFLGCGCLGWAFAAILVVFLFVVALGPIGGQRSGSQSGCLQTAHAIGLAMYSYANDNNGNYPDGKSSTEVFQKLLDGGYVADPTIFYIPAAGKTKAELNQKLKPENVCWDVTAGLTSKSPGELPVLFLTGYRVSYTPGGSAVPITQPYPQFYGPTSRTWTQWWNNPNPRPTMGPGAGVYYMNNSAAWKIFAPTPDGSGSIPNFISPDYVPDGKTYRQLTPDGVMPP